MPKKWTIEDKIAEIVADPETLESALRNVSPEVWMLIVQLLGDLAEETNLDIPTTTPAMRENIWCTVEMLGGAVRNAAALWAIEPIAKMNKGY